MKKFKTFSTVIAMLICFVSLAQEKTITGVVSDNLGPLPGANVTVKTTTRGTQTDFDGKYTIKASKGETLVFSFVGYSSKSITIGKNNIINVKLESAQTLQEVVVMSYDDKKESDYNGYLSKPLQGKTTGVQVSATNANIKIRGYSPITKDEQKHYPNSPSKYDSILQNNKSIN